MDKKLLAGLSPAYALTQGQLPIKATADLLKDTLSGGDKRAELEAENADYKKKLAAMQAAQAGQPIPMKKGGKVSSASKRADGIATKGKTRGRIV